MILKEKILLIGVAVLFKKSKSKNVWFLVKKKDSEDWELPKTNVRRGESSVRAVIRMMGEQGGMDAKVFEEAGRSNGASMVNNKPVSNRSLYYLMMMKEGHEVLGFEDYGWFEYQKAARKLKNKKELAMLKSARDILKEVEKRKKIK